MIRFLFKSLIFGLVIFFVVFTILNLADIGLKNERLGSVSKGIETDVLILGTSRAYRHFDTDQLEQHLGKKFFNLGLDASGFETQKALLEYYLKYNTYPEEIIWEYNFGFLNHEEVLYDSEQLIPIADENAIFELLETYDAEPINFFLFEEFRYFGYNNLIIRGLINYLKPIEFQRYKVQVLSWDKTEFEKRYLDGSFEYKKKISSESVLDFANIIHDLAENNVQLTMVFTPMYQGVFRKKDEKEEFLSYYDSLFNSFTIKNINLLNSEISKDTLNFYNVLHMNRHGVDLFSEEFSDFY